MIRYALLFLGLAVASALYVGEDKTGKIVKYREQEWKIIEVLDWYAIPHYQIRNLETGNEEIVAQSKVDDHRK